NGSSPSSGRDLPPDPRPVPPAGAPASACRHLRLARRGGTGPKDAMGGFSILHRGEEEQALLARGVRRLAGVDEAGRGPLAGPVVAAAVVFHAAVPDGIDDSKKLTARQRALLHDEIVAGADVGIAILSPATIDRLNILRASLEAMRRAVLALTAPPDHILVDGRDC